MRLMLPRAVFETKKGKIDKAKRQTIINYTRVS